MDLTDYRTTGGKLRAFTSVGCYPIVYVTGDNDCLCAKCASKKSNVGAVAAADVYWEGEPLTCDDCGDEIESAYGVPDEQAHL